MIPLTDDVIQFYLAEKLKFLKKHPALIDRIFYTGKRETLSKLREFITKKPIKVVIGYPKDQNSLPCYVITQAPEQEIPLGLGDGTEEFLDYEGGIGEDSDTEAEMINKLSEFILGTYMNSTIRVECWSDNGDLTSYMYAILKWCIWTSRSQMLKNGWVNIKLSGTDLEPVPDYMPIFIYRRAAQITFMNENLYYQDIKEIEGYLDILDKIENVDDGSGNGDYILKENDNGETEVINKDTGETEYIIKDEDNDPDNPGKEEEGGGGTHTVITTPDGEVVYDDSFFYILRPHYFESTITSEDD